MCEIVSMTFVLLKTWLARTLAMTVLMGVASLAVSTLTALLAAGNDTFGAGVLAAFGRVLWTGTLVGLAVLVLLMAVHHLGSTVPPPNATGDRGT